MKYVIKLSVRSGGILYNRVDWNEAKESFPQVIELDLKLHNFSLGSSFCLFARCRLFRGFNGHGMKRVFQVGRNEKGQRKTKHTLGPEFMYSRLDVPTPHSDTCDKETVHHICLCLFSQIHPCLLLSRVQSLSCITNTLMIQRHLTFPTPSSRVLDIQIFSLHTHTQCCWPVCGSMHRMASQWWKTPFCFLLSDVLWEGVSPG